VVPGIINATTVSTALLAVGFKGEQADAGPPARSTARQLVIAVGMTASELEEVRETVDQHPELGVVVVTVGALGHDRAAAVVDVDGPGNVIAVEPPTWADRLTDVTLFSLAQSEAAEVIALVAASRREG